MDKESLGRPYFVPTPAIAIDRPGLAAEARLKLLEGWGVDGPFVRSIAEVRAAERLGHQVPLEHPEVQRARHFNGRDVASSPLYWISPEMSRLVASSSRSIPDDVGLELEILRSPSGLAWYAEGLPSHPAGGDEMRVTAHAWSVIGPEESDHPAPVLSLASYEWHDLGMGYLGQTAWPLGQALGEAKDDSTAEDRRFFVALHLLLASPGVADASEEPSGRPTRRRLQRAGADLGATRVIHLRGAQERTTSSGSPEEGRYHHRWIVDPHWRSQPYGPGRSLRKAIWIRPYVKGPEGAPLLAGEKVRALGRRERGE